jgi:hypothetical protein
MSAKCRNPEMCFGVFVFRRFKRGWTKDCCVWEVEFFVCLWEMCLFASGYDGDDWERHIGKRPETPKHVSGFLWFGRERDVAEWPRAVCGRRRLPHARARSLLLQSRPACAPRGAVTGMPCGTRPICQRLSDRCCTNRPRFGSGISASTGEVVTARGGRLPQRCCDGNAMRHQAQLPAATLPAMPHRPTAFWQ